MVNQQSSSVHNKAYVEMCFGSLVVYTMKLIKMYLRSLVCVQNKDYVQMVFNSLFLVNNKAHVEECFIGRIGG